MRENHGRGKQRKIPAFSPLLTSPSQRAALNKQGAFRPCWTAWHVLSGGGHILVR